jgi:hypothetical protein
LGLRVNFYLGMSLDCEAAGDVHGEPYFVPEAVRFVQMADYCDNPFVLYMHEFQLPEEGFGKRVRMHTLGGCRSVSIVDDAEQEMENYVGVIYSKRRSWEAWEFAHNIDFTLRWYLCTCEVVLTPVFVGLYKPCRLMVHIPNRSRLHVLVDPKPQRVRKVKVDNLAALFATADDATNEDGADDEDEKCDDEDEADEGNIDWEPLVDHAACNNGQADDQQSDSDAASQDSVIGRTLGFFDDGPFTPSGGEGAAEGEDAMPLTPVAGGKEADDDPFAPAPMEADLDVPWGELGAAESSPESVPSEEEPVFFYLPGNVGYIAFYPDIGEHGEFKAWCTRDGHKDCYRSKAKRSNRRGSHRPVASLVAWLEDGGEHTSRTGHMAVKHKWYTFALRKACRHRLKLWCGSEAILRKEGDQGVNSEEEPMIVT